MTRRARDGEPRVPADLRKALWATAMVKTQWRDLTPIARRDFISWMESAKQPEAHKRRIEKACVMLAAGKRRPDVFQFLIDELKRAWFQARKFYKPIMSNATKRAILRWIHLVLAIPVVGYAYSPFTELPSYAPIVRYVAFPVVLLSGLWMYAGVIFAIMAVAVWLGAYQLFGMVPAILSLVALFIARKIWLVIRVRQSEGSA
jgi:hypothetical protein